MEYNYYTCREATKMFHILWSIIVGFVVGLLARAILPGAQHLGFIATTALGIAGSIVGGLIARVFSKPKEGSKFHPAGLVLSVIGAIIVLYLWQRFVH
jgi:uncharacterized membrane protein YeaQ/YmgE (transglycosylase-associated protein family)